MKLILTIKRTDEGRAFADKIVAHFRPADVVVDTDERVALVWGRLVQSTVALLVKFVVDEPTVELITIERKE